MHIIYFGGHNIMHWGCFSYYGATKLVEMNCDRYQQIMRNHLIKIGSNMGSQSWTYHQNITKIHDLRTTKKFFSQKRCLH